MVGGQPRAPDRPPAVDALGGRADLEVGVMPARAASPALPIDAIALGAAMLLRPIGWPPGYLAAPVWLGFIFLLDRINAWLGAPSLFTRTRAGNRALLINRMASG